MKNYNTPKAELLLLNTADIITASDIKTMSWNDFVNDESDLDI